MQQGKPGLIQVIRQQMESAPEQAITFRDYMELCLYHPEFGYYMSEEIKLGKEGDFYTGSFIGGVLAETVVEWMLKEPFWDKEAPHEPIRIIEWGGGSGRFAKQLLDALIVQAPDIYSRLEYISIESSGSHRRLQEEALAAHAAKLRFLTADDWYEEGPWRSVLLFSNELPDAFPVHRIVARDGAWYEIYVCWDAELSALKEIELPLKNAAVQAYLHDEALPMRDGQQFEVNLAALSWLKSVALGIGQGTVMTIDYGDVREELYAAHRMRGTLLCYWKHQAEDAPLSRPGEQDMTAHVNFSSLIRAGEEAGLTSSQLLTQKQFLVENGLLLKLQDHDARDPFSPAAKRNRAIRQLLISDQMSELFKVLIQKKEEARPE
ncbi:class I SAM-dependent methyltransferase [Paenibacillus cremeus]|uniref:SAM-dependent methyltransferase n=1 Tax=Paenibacillus cremeus TaxID=2163881 RepID=A0A559KBV9_9BACL|nr:SAM-dependent methyltransferase [Paenibacillus cremeus]TVY09618.1 SAM-dependent methyltransferase [Paenibacillus cremeus]